MKSVQTFSSLFTSLLLASFFAVTTLTTALAGKGGESGGGGGNSGVEIAKSSNSIPKGLDRFHQLLWKFQNGSKPKLSSIESYKTCTEFSQSYKGLVLKGETTPTVVWVNDVRKYCGAGIALGMRKLGALTEVRGTDLRDIEPVMHERMGTKSEYQEYYEQQRELYENQLVNPFENFFKKKRCGTAATNDPGRYPTITCPADFKVKTYDYPSLTDIFSAAGNHVVLDETDQSYIYPKYNVQSRETFRDIEIRSYNGFLIAVDRADLDRPVGLQCGDDFSIPSLPRGTLAVDGVCRIFYFTNKEIVQE